MSCLHIVALGQRVRTHTSRLLFLLLEVGAGNLSSLCKKFTCTQIFSEAQGEKEVCKELCSSWIYFPKTDVLGWACLAQLKTEGIYG